MRLDDKQRRWRKLIMGRGEEVSVRFLGRDIERPDMNGAEIRQAVDRLTRPFRVGWGVHLKHRSQIIEDREHKLAAAPEKVLQRAPRLRLEQSREAALAGQEGRKTHANDAVRFVGLAADAPRSPRLDHEPIASLLGPTIGRKVDPSVGTVAVADPVVRGEQAELFMKP